MHRIRICSELVFLFVIVEKYDNDQNDVGGRAPFLALTLKFGPTKKQ